MIGATDPAEAAEGTIRKMFASSKGENAVHGSDLQKTEEMKFLSFSAKAKSLQTEADYLRIKQ